MPQPWRRACLLACLLVAGLGPWAAVHSGGDGCSDVEARLRALDLLLRHPVAVVRDAAEASVFEAAGRRLGAENLPWYARAHGNFPCLLVLLEVCVLLLVVLIWEELWLKSSLAITTAACFKRCRALLSNAPPADQPEDQGRASQSNPARQEADDYDAQQVELFWKGVASAQLTALAEDGDHETVVFFSRRQFIGKVGGCARIHVNRRGDTSEPLSVTVRTQEAFCSQFGAKAGVDFDLIEQELWFEPSQRSVTVEVPLPRGKHLWAPTRWFHVELASVLVGSARLGGPAVAEREDCHGPVARVYILQDVAFPPGATQEMWCSHHFGFKLAFLYLNMQRKVRGEKWWKTLLGLLYYPFHTVVVSALVKTFMLDWAANPDTGPGDSHAIVLLACIYFLSVALGRWGDWSQTKNRGRTGGIRQGHRSDLFCKLMMLEYTEQKQVDAEQWFYVALQTVDSVTVDIYWQGFMFLQSSFALILSLSLLIFSALGRGTYSHSHTVTLVLLCTLMPFSIAVGMGRRWGVEFLLNMRMEEEATWVATWAWLTGVGPQLFGLGAREKASVERKFAEESKSFVSWHQKARDELNDTTWIIRWATCVAYCSFLAHGGVSMLQGHMSAGEFVLLLSVATSYSKYSCRVFSSAVQIGKGSVHLKKLCRLLNMQEHRSMQEELKKEGMGDAGEQHLRSCTALEEMRAIEFQGEVELRTTSARALGPMCPVKIRPGQQLSIPLGRVVRVSGGSESLRYSFMALIAGVVSPTRGEVVCPKDVWAAMLPMTPLRSSHLTVLEALEMSRAKRRAAAQNLARALGLEPDHDTSVLAPGELQVLALVRMLLRDPDILVASRPLSYSLRARRPSLVRLLRLWQARGADAILELAESASAELDVLAEDDEEAIFGWEDRSRSIFLACDPSPTASASSFRNRFRKQASNRSHRHRTLIITDEDMGPADPGDHVIDLTMVIEECSVDAQWARERDEDFVAERASNGATKEDQSGADYGSNHDSGTESDSCAESDASSTPVMCWRAVSASVAW